MNLAVSSDQSFAAAIKWAHNCDCSHDGCVQRAARDLPTRMLSIDDDSVKLIDESELWDGASYAALS